MRDVILIDSKILRKALKTAITEKAFTVRISQETLEFMNDVIVFETIPIDKQSQIDYTELISPESFMRAWAMLKFVQNQPLSIQFKERAIVFKYLEF